MLDFGPHWIETTAYRDRNETVWIVKIGGEIAKVGVTLNDPSGANAFDEASAWAAANAPDVTFNWKHDNGQADPASEA